MRSVFLLALLPACLCADVLTLGPSNQEVTLLSSGPDGTGAGNFRLIPGPCALQVTMTVCSVSGRYTGLVSGIYTLTLSYPGNGPSPLFATTSPAGSDSFTISLTNGSLVLTIKPDGGLPSSFYDTNAIFNLAAPRCLGLTPCGVALAGNTAGSTIIGLISAKFDTTPVIRVLGGVITASAYGGAPSLAPASWVEIYGTNLAASPGQAWQAADFRGSTAPTMLAGTAVTIGDKPTFVQYVSNRQVNVETPSSLFPGLLPVIVTTPGGTSQPYLITINQLQPALLAPPVFQIGGVQYAFAEFARDNAFVLPPGSLSGVDTRRAVPGDVVVLYGIGFGPVSPNIEAGQIVQQANTLHAFTASVSGHPATVLFAGLVYGFVGLYQFNIVIPGILPNDAAPFTFSVGGTPGVQTLYLPIGN